MQFAHILVFASLLLVLSVLSGAVFLSVFFFSFLYQSGPSVVLSVPVLLDLSLAVCSYSCLYQSLPSLVCSYASIAVCSSMLLFLHLPVYSFSCLYQIALSSVYSNSVLSLKSLIITLFVQYKPDPHPVLTNLLLLLPVPSSAPLLS